MTGMRSVHARPAANVVVHEHAMRPPGAAKLGKPAELQEISQAVGEASRRSAAARTRPCDRERDC